AEDDDAVADEEQVGRVAHLQRPENARLGRVDDVERVALERVEPLAVGLYDVGLVDAGFLHVRRRELVAPDGRLLRRGGFVIRGGCARRGALAGGGFGPARGRGGVNQAATAAGGRQAVGRDHL